MQTSGSLNPPRLVTEEVAAATSSWWPPRPRCNAPCGNSAPGALWEDLFCEERIRRCGKYTNQARFAIGDVTSYDGVTISGNNLGMDSITGHIGHDSKVIALK